MTFPRYVYVAKDRALLTECDQAERAAIAVRAILKALSEATTAKV